MNTRLSVDVLAPGALSASELEIWRGFTRASARLSSPYFAPEYALAADGVVPGAAVAVLHRGGAIDGFLPFQKRGGRALPLAAPLTDYHGVIARPGSALGAEFDWTAVVRGMGASSFAFNGLVAEVPPPGGRAFVQAAMVSDVSGGLEAYLEPRPRTRKFFKDKARRLRALASEVGEVEFRFAEGEEAFDFVIAEKRAQYALTGRHDIFACGWTERFLRRLWETRTPEFGGRFTTLHAGGRLVSAEYGLRAGDVHHIWFPAYDPAYARFGPGTIMTIEMVKAAAADPTLSALDFGANEEAYKAMYASPAGAVYEGSVEAAPLRVVSSRMTQAALSTLPLKPVAHARDRLRRRFAIISACETTASGWMGGAVTAFRHAAQRSGAPASAGA